MNTAREEYGESRLIGAVERGDGLDAPSLRDAILADVQAFIGGAPPHDDMTLILLKIEHVAPVPGPRPVTAELAEIQ
jgi:sigma-B regulation protein RsbU (phosphoserine phosphatase)